MHNRAQSMLAGIAAILASTILFPPPAASAPIPQTLLDKANAPFVEGEKPPFLGIFTHTMPLFSLPDAAQYIAERNQSNPYLVGYTIKIQWRNLHPAKDQVNWDELEKAIATAASAGRVVNLGVLAGGAAPEWIYDAGVLRFGPVRVGSRMMTAPLPWDPKFIELYWSDMAELARRYDNDPRVLAIELLGPTFNYAGEEFHAPDISAVEPYGWTKELALENWKYFIGQYNTLFPHKKIYAVVSQMYRGENELSGLVADYFVKTCAGRAYLQTHQLTAAPGSVSFGAQTMRRESDKAPVTHELGRALSGVPNPGHDAAMYVYNTLLSDNPFYLQLWARDSADPKYAKMILDAYEKYGSLTADECKEQMLAEGLFTRDTPSTQPRGFLPGDLGLLPPEGYPGHTDPAVVNWSPF